MRAHEVPSELVRWIAKEAIAAYREQRDWYELDEDAAVAAAVSEVMEGAAVDLDALERERATEPEQSAEHADDELPWG